MPASPNDDFKGASAIEIPSALEHLGKILAPPGRRLAIFLDYDGTLTPIVDRPELAVLSGPTREVVQGLAVCATVVILSGRDLDDVQQRVGIDGIIYAGSHGFDIIGPGGLRKKVATEFLPILDVAETEVRTKLDRIPGALVERKCFSIAAHYRLADQKGVDAVVRAVNEVAGRHRELRMVSGKKLYELQPDIDWDKGRAMLWLIETLELEQLGTLLFYIGDDRTDEDAFRALGKRGTSIIVTEQTRSTAAQYALKNPAEVERFLAELASFASDSGNCRSGSLP